MSVSFHVAGTVLGHYRLGRRIGRGGMGEVYEADDLRLDRRVALKILSPMVVSRPESVRRFVQEAKSASALNHPHILSVYDIGEGSISGQSVHYIAMELIDGGTLRDEIHFKRVPLKRLISTLAQVADALARAHTRGIVHRDLKPDNIMVTVDGYAKIIDFGLAKLIEPRIPIRSHDSDAATFTLTKEGAFLGTIGYMAPEQVEQKAADYRSDIFSFGCILYEAVTRARAFEGPSDVEILYKILHDAPAFDKLDSVGPVELKRLIARCLEKSPEDRYQSMKDVAIELRAIEGRVSGGEAPAVLPAARRVTPKTWLAAALAVAALATFATIVIMRQPPPAKQFQMHSLTTWPSNEEDCRISPDGTWISFLSNRHGKEAIWIRQLKGGEPTMLVDRPPKIMSHVWSPDSNQIAYLSRTDGAFLQFIPAFGGPPGQSVRLADEFKDDARLVRWIGPNIYIESRGALWRMDSPSQRMTKLATPATVDRARVQWFGVKNDETKIVYNVYTVDQVSMWLANLDGTNPQRLTGADRPYSDYAPSFGGPDENELFFSSTRSSQVDVWRVPLGSDSDAATQITFSPAVEWVEDVSPDGRTVAVREDRKYAQLSLWDKASGQTSQLSSEAIRDLWPSAARAGSLIAFQRTKAVSRRVSHILNANILLSELKDGRLSDPRLSVTDAGLPLLSGNGQWLAYVKPRGTRQFELWMKDLRTEHQSKLADRVRAPGQYDFPVDGMRRNFIWAPGSDALYFVELTESERYIIRRAIPTTGQSSPIVAAHERVELQDLSLSSDGKLLAYVRMTAGAPGKSEVIVRDLATGRETVWFSMNHDWHQRVFSKGWRQNGLLVLLHAMLDEELNERVEAIQVDANGHQTVMPIAPQGFGGAARLDLASDSLLLVIVGADGAHNIESVSLANGRRRRLTNNRLAGISFAGLDVVAPDHVLFSTQESNSDLWLIYPR